MNKLIIFVVAQLLLSSCSQLLLEPTAPESILSAVGVPETKSAGGEEAMGDQSAVQYYFQKNRRVILMHHVAYKDSAYVQTLSDDDMQSLGMTDEQKEFGSRYVVDLNEINKRR